MIVWVAAWMRVVLKVVSLAAVLSHQVTLLPYVGDTGEKQHTGNYQLIYVHLSYFNRLPLK